jgi:carbon monoxide dehydrogenase subunit G
MPATKTGVSHVSGQTTSTTTTATDIGAIYRAMIGVSIVQVGTATTAATFRVQVSPDGGTNYYDFTGDIAAGTAAATYTWAVELPDASNRVRIVFVQQSGGTSSTLSAVVGELTAI